MSRPASKKELLLNKKSRVWKTPGTSILLGIIIGFTSHGASGFGRTGHRIIAQITMHYLPQPAKENVLAVLGSTLPEDAATWMDDMLSNPDYDYMKAWHYISIPKGDSYRLGQSDNLITALNHAFNDIRQDRVSARARKEDVMILFHLLGDMHQPLHAGYPDDKLGNTMQVKCDGNETNLHHVWDIDIIESRKITAEACLALGATRSDAEVKAIGAGNFITWMEDSRALLPQVYDFAGHTPDDAYMRKNKALTESQLLKAGIRLARVLELLFGNGNEPADAVIAGAETVSKGTERSALTINTTNVRRQTADTLSPGQAALHTGKAATVCGKIYGGKFLKQSGETFMGMGTAYPGSPFTIVILGKDRDRFGVAPEVAYDGTAICVTGIIRDYKGKAAIIISKEEQIQIQ